MKTIRLTLDLMRQKRIRKKMRVALERHSFHLDGRENSIRELRDLNDQYIAVWLDQMCRGRKVDVYEDVRIWLKRYPGAAKHVNSWTQKVIDEIGLEEAEEQLRDADVRLDFATRVYRHFSEIVTQPLKPHQPTDQ